MSIPHLRLDTSGDNPAVLPEFKVAIENDTFHLYAPYRISPYSDDGGTKVIIEGEAQNDPSGELLDQIGYNVSPFLLRKRIVEAFAGRLDTVRFISLIIQDALGGQVSVKSLSIDEEKLKVTLIQSPKES